MKIDFILNGEKVMVEAPAASRLLDVLREAFGLMGPKEACGEGECGACSVLLNGELVPSCIMALGSVKGREVLTIEGFAKTRRFKVLSESFAEAGAVQCGYCTPGMILAAEALLCRTPEPTEDDIRRAISGNLCRCTGYHLIVEAVKLAAKHGAKAWSGK